MPRRPKRSILPHGPLEMPKFSELEHHVTALEDRMLPVEETKSPLSRATEETSMPFPVAKPDETYQGPIVPSGTTATPAPAIAPSIPVPTELPVPEGYPRRFTFTQKVRILDGFQYTGQFKNVPEWVNPNWLNYEGKPPLPYKPGPTISLPDGSVVRVNDWLVLEEVDGQRPKMRIYTNDQIEHFFSVQPVASSGSADAIRE
jgi:hypothetical protein